MWDAARMEIAAPRSDPRPVVRHRAEVLGWVEFTGRPITDDQVDEAIEAARHTGCEPVDIIEAVASLWPAPRR